MKKLSSILLTLLLCLLAGQVYAQSERILSYNSDIQVQPDGAMIVTETIRVFSAGQEIRRGIFRTFPTKYKDGYGNTIRVSFDVIEILKNGNPEPWHKENMSNGVKVYIGSSDIYLSPGEYTYTLVYRTTNQLGFYQDYDELYWNVTGLDWGFVIEQASATVRLPRGAEVIQRVAYTGPMGAQGTDYTSGIDHNGNAWFQTTAPLNAFEGLTIAVGFTKGIIPEPTMVDKAKMMLTGNPAVMAAFAGFIILLVYYLFAWAVVGKDPAKSTIIPQFAPPDGYSPAATRYVMKMGYSNRVFAAAVVNMAVKGYLTIEDNKGVFTLTRTDKDESGLSRGEKQIAKKLFRGNKSIVLKQSNHSKIRGAVKALKSDLKLGFEAMNFKENKKYLVPGIVITILALLGIIFTSSVIPLAAFMTVWLSGWTFGTLALVKQVVQTWRGVFAGGVGIRSALKGAGAIGMTLFALPFVAGEVFGLFAFSMAASWGAALVFLLIVLVNIIFKDLMKAPTIMGRQIMDHIEGFKMYLKTAEEERLKNFAPPAKSAKLYEKYLPYALALDVENEWSEKFADVLALSATSGTSGYSPTWYTGRNMSALGAAGLGTALGSSLSSAISSSSTAPGSSSGSSGGGSSGGGGGGGGGGGW